MTSDHSVLAARNGASTLTKRTNQSAWNTLSIVRAEGVHFWDADGKQVFDWSSQLIKANKGHGNPHVIKAIQVQVAGMAWPIPISSKGRARLGELLRKMTPAGLNRTYFTVGRANALELVKKGDT